MAQLIRQLETHNCTLCLDNKTEIGFMEPSVIQHIILCGIPLLVIVLNIPVFVVVPRICDFNKTTQYVMISLAGADILVGILQMTNYIYHLMINTFLKMNNIFCDMFALLSCTFCGVSILTLTFFNVDKVLMLSYPLDYHVRVTQKTVYLILGSIWLFSGVIFILPVIDRLDIDIIYKPDQYGCLPDFANTIIYSSVVIIMIIFIPTVITAISVGKLFCIAHKHNKQISHETPGEVTHFVKKEGKLVLMLVLMTGGFYLFWAPFVTEQLYNTTNGKSLGSTFEFIAIWVAIGNSAINPIIYIPTIRGYRRELVRLIQKFKRNILRDKELPSHMTNPDICSDKSTG